MASWRMSAKAALVFATAVLSSSVALADDDTDDGDAPPPCRPGNAPSAVTGRCVPDFPEHICPDGGMSIWNRCPRSAPCPDDGASVNGECSGPLEEEEEARPVRIRATA